VRALPVHAKLILHFGVLKPEERYLEAKFGESYRSLCEQCRGIGTIPEELNNLLALSAPTTTPTRLRRPRSAALMQLQSDATFRAEKV
jgi:hypothetical protein